MPEVRGNKVKAKKRYFAECGTYLKTLSDDIDPAYSEKLGYSPKNLGCAKFILKPNRGKSIIEVKSIV